jgi:hypothetical protein
MKIKIGSKIYSTKDLFNNKYLELVKKGKKRVYEQRKGWFSREGDLGLVIYSAICFVIISCIGIVAHPYFGDGLLEFLYYFFITQIAIAIYIFYKQNPEMGVECL